MRFRNLKYGASATKGHGQHSGVPSSTHTCNEQIRQGAYTPANNRFTKPKLWANLRVGLFPFLLVLALSGCGVYSFTGASISPEVKSVTIEFIPSYAPLAPANMPQAFTESLRDLFVSRTNLDLLTKNGDIRFSGYISAYQTRPVAIQGNETAAKNRLTINVNITYTDSVDPAKSFEKTFSRFADFDASQNLASVEQGLIEEINEQLILDIFNEAMVNW